MKTRYILFTLILLLMVGNAVGAEMPESFWPDNNSQMGVYTFINPMNSNYSFSGIYNSDSHLPLRVIVNQENREAFQSSVVNEPLSFIDQNSEIFGISTSELEIVQNLKVSGRRYFTARQLLDGRPVSGSLVVLRTSKDDKLMLWGADMEKDRNKKWRSFISSEEAVEILAQYCGIDFYRIIQADEYWIRDSGSIIPVYFVRLAGEEAVQRPLAMINAEDGAIVGYYNEIYYEDIQGAISAPYFPVRHGQELEWGRLPYTTIQVNNREIISDSEGEYLFDNLVNGENYQIQTSLSGRWAEVENDDGANARFNGQVNAPAVYDVQWTLENGRIDEFNVYYHTNFIHSFYEVLDPEFTALDYPMPVIVGYGDNYENAFWNGFGMTFGAGGGNLRNLALFADIIYHEYTHGVTGGIYPPGMLPYEGQSGALNEAWSDYIPCSIHDNPAMSLGIYHNTPQIPMRNLDNQNRYPENFVDEVHTDGLIPGGSMWHTRELLGREITDPLFHFARYGLAEDFESYLIEVLLQDDNNEDISDGTPHCDAIYEGFGRHGIGPGVLPNLVLENLLIEEENEDNLYLPGENLELSFTLVNQVDLYPPDASNVQIEALENDFIIWNNNQLNLGDIAPRENVATPEVIRFSIVQDLPTQYIDLQIKITANNGLYEQIYTHRIIAGAPEILIVDDDGARSYNEYYENMMDQLFTAADNWNTLSGTPSDEYIEEFPVVIWHTGDARNPISLDDRACIINYVEQGGGLILSGQHIGYQLINDQEFASFLGVSVSNDSLVPARAVVGNASNELSNGITGLVTGMAGVGGTGGAGNQVSPSSMIPTADARSLYSYHYDGGDIAAIQKEFDEGGTVFYFGFGLESISGASHTNLPYEMLWPLINHLGVELISDVEDTPELLPEVFELSQPYPNPFNPETNISYSLPRTSNVKLSIYNMLGQEILTPVNARQEAGTYNIQINLGDYSSGIYFISLESAQNKHIQKAILLK